MYRSACLRLFAALAAAAALGSAGAQARSDQSGPAAMPKSTSPVQASAAPAAAAAGAQTPSSGVVRAQPPAPGQALTPAQEKYGLPKTPMVGGPVDMDLTKPLDIARAIRIGLLRQNAIAIAQTQADAAEGRLIQARSSYFPQVTPTFSYQTNLSPGGSIFINGQRFAGSSTSETRTEVIAARQLIFDTGKREANVGNARRNLFASAYGVGNSRQDVILAVTADYFNLLRDRELVRVQQESVKRAEETERALQAEFAAGTAARSDTLQAEADLANARVALLSAQVDYQTQEATLKNAMGVVSNVPLTLDDTPIAPPPTTPDPIPLDRYIQTAYANRLDIKQQQERVYAQGYNVRLARINAGLSVEADVTEGYQLDPTSGQERTFIVSATYPLFDAGNTRAVVRENKAQWELEKRTLDQLQQNARLNVDQSYANREQAKQRLIASNIAVTAAQENYAAALAKNKEGLINILELINAEVLLINAQVQQVQSTYDYHVADAQLLRDTGLNDPIFLPKVPGARPPVPPHP
jgi:outer membrane protein TolC